MSGELVIIRAFGGKALVRRVWASDENAVYVSDDTNYQKLIKNEEALMPVGFTYDDVFEYNPALATSIKGKPVDWRELRPWKKLRN